MKSFKKPKFPALKIRYKGALYELQKPRAAGRKRVHARTLEDIRWSRIAAVAEALIEVAGSESDPMRKREAARAVFLALKEEGWKIGIW